MVGGRKTFVDEVRRACVSASRPEQNNITHSGTFGQLCVGDFSFYLPRSAKHGQLELHVAQGR